MCPIILDRDFSWSRLAKAKLLSLIIGLILTLTILKTNYNINLEINNLENREVKINNNLESREFKNKY